MSITADSFLPAILASPADDFPRLVFADWLEENGQPERGEFIRLQIAIEGRMRGPGGRVSDNSPWVMGDSRLQAMRRRERELLYSFCPDGEHTYHWLWSHEIDEQVLNLSFRRGFISSITCPAAAWLAHADALTAQQPIEEVKLTTPIDLMYLRDGVWLIYHDNGGRPIPSRTINADKHPPLRHLMNLATILAVEWPRIRFDVQEGRNTWRTGQATVAFNRQPLGVAESISAGDLIALDEQGYVVRARPGEAIGRVIRDYP